MTELILHINNYSITIAITAYQTYLGFFFFFFFFFASPDANDIVARMEKILDLQTRMEHI